MGSWSCTGVVSASGILLPYKFASFGLYGRCIAALLANNSHAKTTLRVTLQQNYDYAITYFKMYGTTLTLFLSRSIDKKPLKYERLKYSYTPSTICNGKYCGSRLSMYGKLNKVRGAHE